MLMADTTAEQELRAELLKKDRELIEAAQAGQELLEENTQLLSKLESVKEDCIYYKQQLSIQSKQKREELLELQVTASNQITELEQEIQTKTELIRDLKKALQLERQTNEQITASLEIERQKLHDMMEEVCKEKEKRLQHVNKLENELQLMQNNLVALQNTYDLSLSELKEERRISLSLRQELSVQTTHSTSLTDEIESLQNTCAEWQRCYEEEMNRTKELTEALNMQHLQQQEDQQEEIGSISLMTELYNAFEARPVSVLSSISDAEAYSSDVFVNDEYTCLKCQTLQNKIDRLQDDHRDLNDQLLRVVEQKYHLQQQLEAWQIDIECLIQRQVEHSFEK